MTLINKADDLRRTRAEAEYLGLGTQDEFIEYSEIVPTPEVKLQSKEDALLLAKGVAYFAVSLVYLPLSALCLVLVALISELRRMIADSRSECPSDVQTKTNVSINVSVEVNIDGQKYQY